MNDSWLSEEERPELVTEAPAMIAIRSLRCGLRRAAVVGGVVLVVAAALAVFQRTPPQRRDAPDLDWEEVPGM